MPQTRRFPLWLLLLPTSALAGPQAPAVPELPARTTGAPTCAAGSTLVRDADGVRDLCTTTVPAQCGPTTRLYIDVADHFEGFGCPKPGPTRLRDFCSFSFTMMTVCGMQPGCPTGTRFEARVGPDQCLKQVPPTCAGGQVLARAGEDLCLAR